MVKLVVFLLVQLGITVVNGGALKALVQPVDFFRFDDDLSTNPNDVGFYLFPNPNNFSDFDVLEYGNLASISKSRFSTGKKLVVLTHGFTQKLTSDFPQVLIRAYLNAGFEKTSNIIAVDWGKLSGAYSSIDLAIVKRLEELPLYIEVVENVPVVGKRIEEFIVFLQNNAKISGPAQVHLVGQSLGAHISGYAGMYYQKAKNVKLDRITGTDPAGPLFQFNPHKMRLDKSDAEFVHIVHTNEAGFGFIGPLGDVDFFVNGAGPIQIQPACANQILTNPFCSHNTAPHYYGMSILDRSMKASKHLLFRGDDTVTFGEFCPTEARGKYYIDIDLPASEVPSH